MKAVVWHGVGKVALEDVPDPVPEDATIGCGRCAYCRAGPVGQPATLSARIQRAGRVLNVDGSADRLETARVHTILTQQEPMPSVIDAYEAFDRREPGRTKVALELAG